MTQLEELGLSVCWCGNEHMPISWCVEELGTKAHVGKLEGKYMVWTPKRETNTGLGQALLHYSTNDQRVILNDSPFSNLIYFYYDIQWVLYIKYLVLK